MISAEATETRNRMKLDHSFLVGTYPAPITSGTFMSCHQGSRFVWSSDWFRSGERNSFLWYHNGPYWSRCVCVQEARTATTTNLPTSHIVYICTEYKAWLLKWCLNGSNRSNRYCQKLFYVMLIKILNKEAFKCLFLLRLWENIFPRKCNLKWNDVFFNWGFSYIWFTFGFSSVSFIRRLPLSEEKVFSQAMYRGVELVHNKSIGQWNSCPCKECFSNRQKKKN